MKKNILLFICILLLLGCNTQRPCVCTNQTITKEVEVPVIQEVEKIVYVNQTQYKEVCNSTVVMSLTRRLKHCEELQIKYYNNTLCQFNLEKINNTLNITKLKLDEVTYNYTECKEDLEDCYYDLKNGN